MTSEGPRAGGATDSVVRVDAVGHRFGELTVLREVSFDLQPGSVTALVGPNGSGKTTILRIIADLLAPTAGQVERPDRDRPVGYLPQHPDFRPAFSVEETLRFYAGLLDADVDVGSVLDRVGLLAARDRRVEALSGGMRRLLGLALAALGRPPVALLDEPTGDLDPGMTEHVFEVIADLARTGAAVLLATHDLSGASRADTVLVLDRGTIVAAGPPAALIGEAGVESLAGAFLDLVDVEAHAVSVGLEGL